jgi:hypothetical protein
MKSKKQEAPLEDINEEKQNCLPKVILFSSNIREIFSSPQDLTHQQL